MFSICQVETAVPGPLMAESALVVIREGATAAPETQVESDGVAQSGDHVPE